MSTKFPITARSGRQRGDTQTDAAYAAIRLAILRCVHAPGDRVSEVRLADRYGFGRAAVRTALARLHHERLVDAVPRHGYTIAPVTFTDVQELFGARLAVEPATAYLAAERADATALTELERVNRACRLMPDRPDLVAVREANKAFHAAVGHASGNGRLARLAAELMDELDRVLYLPQLEPLWERLDDTAADHDRIIAALRARDPRAAAAAASDHVLANRRSAIDALVASPGVRAINLRQR